MRQTAKQLNRKKFLEIEIIGLKLGHFMEELICSIYSFFVKKILIYLLANSSRETVGVQVIMVINHCPISPCLFHSSSYLMANKESAIFSMNIC